ncbi:hypothetical protein DICPUDRAFT_157085 [Dictyostelium purpureum]|uniref:Pseudouridine synthase RsuA/RluA-like domain-containing protein n=1 Tax=Dictyostelium purpureum TaxID=5786 RepID=F0ZY78_DICPU|nr:uncharacterized protein DICPUDRAFT_157085 [Dictyostelium purpureum]EGC31101.1 hypothetical protein DICPUDRAFT_157085 [Dictyostelium purpureum]|eukprot:XP_003292378.1 hypothetical protein DICPUDRAFT_157085 [Dictyostelium purpureum]
MIIKNSKKLRIDRLLSNLGIVERSSVPRFLNEKRVTISGKKATLSSKASPDEVRIDGKLIENPSALHLALHKPSGYICSTVNDGDHKVVYDLLPKDFQSRKPIPSIAGRLDKWVTGLVIFSQDGKLVERIITPKDDGCGKDYEVVLKNKLGGDEIGVFESGGLMLRGEEAPCKPAKLEILDESKNKVKVTLFEGRYHQVRRMFAANDNKALEIHRTRIGPVELGDLPVGKWRHLTEKEIQDLYNIQVSQSKKKRDYKEIKKDKEKDKLYKAIVEPDQDKTYNDLDSSEDTDIFDDDMDYDEENDFEDFDNIDEEKETLSISQQDTTKNQIQKDYEEKLNILIKDEAGSPTQETEEDINISISKQVKQIYDDAELKTDTVDPYKELREQIHKKMRLKLLRGSGLVYDKDTGFYLPKESLENNISDEDLDRLMDQDEDFKEFEEFEQEQEMEEQEQFAQSDFQSKNKNKPNNSESKEHNKNRIKSKPNRHLDDGSEVYEVDSTPTPIDKVIKQKTNKIFNSKKRRGTSSRSIKKK